MMTMIKQTSAMLMLSIILLILFNGTAITSDSEHAPTCPTGTDGSMEPCKSSKIDNSEIKFCKAEKMGREKKPSVSCDEGAFCNSTKHWLCTANFKMGTLFCCCNIEAGKCNELIIGAERSYKEVFHECPTGDNNEGTMECSSTYCIIESSAAIEAKFSCDQKGKCLAMKKENPSDSCGKTPDSTFCCCDPALKPCDAQGMRDQYKQQFGERLLTTKGAISPHTTEQILNAIAKTTSKRQYVLQLQINTNEEQETADMPAEKQAVNWAVLGSGIAWLCLLALVFCFALVKYIMVSKEADKQELMKAKQQHVKHQHVKQKPAPDP